jgi:hypothetical protein
MEGLRLGVRAWSKWRLWCWIFQGM